MANPEHVEVVKQGALAINGWLATHPGEGLNLEGADLRRINLTRGDLTGANLIGADLEGADLFQTILIGADLQRAKRRCCVGRHERIARTGGKQDYPSFFQVADGPAADVWFCNRLDL